jgi:hypothetical protein
LGSTDPGQTGSATGEEKAYPGSESPRRAKGGSSAALLQGVHRETWNQTTIERNGRHMATPVPPAAPTYAMGSRSLSGS